MFLIYCKLSNAPERYCKRIFESAPFIFPSRFISAAIASVSIGVAVPLINCFKILEVNSLFLDAVTLDDKKVCVVAKIAYLVAHFCISDIGIGLALILKIPVINKSKAEKACEEDCHYASGNWTTAPTGLPVSQVFRPATALIRCPSSRRQTQRARLARDFSMSIPQQRE